MSGTTLSEHADRDVKRDRILSTASRCARSGVEVRTRAVAQGAGCSQSTADRVLAGAGWTKHTERRAVYWLPPVTPRTEKAT